MLGVRNADPAGIKVGAPSRGVPVRETVTVGGARVRLDLNAPGLEGELREFSLSLARALGKDISVETYGMDKLVVEGPGGTGFFVYLWEWLALGGLGPREVVEFASALAEDPRSVGEVALGALLDAFRVPRGELGVSLSDRVLFVETEGEASLSAWFPLRMAAPLLGEGYVAVSTGRSVTRIRASTTAVVLRPGLLRLVGETHGATAEVLEAVGDDRIRLLRIRNGSPLHLGMPYVEAVIEKGHHTYLLPVCPVSREATDPRTLAELLKATLNQL